MLAAMWAAVLWVVALSGNAGAEVQNPGGLAVIIGNSEYRSKDIPPVDYAGRDAEAFTRYVVDVLGYDPANVIHMKNATRREMLEVLGDPAAAMNDIQARLNILPGSGESDVVVYYSGHGVPGKDGKSFLLPVDVPPHAARTEGYPVRLLYEKLGELRGAGSVRVFLDTCFSGSSDGGRLVEGSPVYQETAFPQNVADRMTVLTAVTSTQIATWDKKAGHGLFTHHLLDALHGRADADKDGKVTALEAKEYLDRHMTSAAWLSNTRQQNATLRGAAGVVLARAKADGTYPGRRGLGPVTPPAGGEEVKVAVGILPKPESKTVRKVRKPADVFRDCEGCPEMVVVPAGKFRMGSPDEEMGRIDNEGPVRRVRILKAFAVGRYEVTVEEYSAFVGETGRDMSGSCYVFDVAKRKWKDRKDRSWKDQGFKQTKRHPVGCISWDDAKSYVEWLSEKTGKDYRLLSEAEWEYVARGGTATSWHWGADAPSIRCPLGFCRGGTKPTVDSEQCEYANGTDRAVLKKKQYREWTLAKCYDRYVHTAPVGSFSANRFRLHDVAGNVWEWVEDCWHENYNGAPEDGEAWLTGGDCSRRVVRGGSWGDPPRFLRSAFRFYAPSGDRYDSSGFRIARTLTP